MIVSENVIGGVLMVVGFAIALFSPNNFYHGGTISCLGILILGQGCLALQNQAIEQKLNKLLSKKAEEEEENGKVD